MTGSKDVLSTLLDPGRHVAAGADLRALEWLTGRPDEKPRAEVTVSVEVADADTPEGRRRRAEYAALRRRVFVDEQELFDRDDTDDADGDPRTVVLVAVALDRAGVPSVVGGVRVAPAVPGGPDLGWWQGGRLAVRSDARLARAGVGGALVRAACARAESLGALRFDATVQLSREAFFRRLGWQVLRPTTVAGVPHLLMHWPIGRVQRLVDAAKAPLGALLSTFTAPGSLGGPGWRGDDAAPVPGAEIVAACDAIVPAMVERDPEWAGWCGVLVNVNDLTASGAVPVGLLDAVAGASASFVARVLAGVRDASRAWGVPVLGGHTQLGVPAALAVTALGRTAAPLRAGGARAGDRVRLAADTGGDWRPRYTGAQWDSTSSRDSASLRALATAFGDGSDAAEPSRLPRPAAAKDVSMAGCVGTLGMLAEAGGCGAVLDVAAVPRPAGASTGDWLTCFPGWAMVTADRPGSATAGLADGPVPGLPAVSAGCGELVAGAGVGLRWPDGEVTAAVSGAATGLGRA